MVFKKKESEFDKEVLNFEDFAGLGTRELNFGLWYMRHRSHIFLFFVYLMAIIGSVLILFTLYYFGNYVLKGMTIQKNTLSGLTSSELTINRKNYFSNISYRFLKLLPTTEKHYDLVGTMTNANEDFSISFDYYFLVNGGKTKVQSSFIYPGEKKYLLTLNQEFENYPHNIKLVIDNLKWSRLDFHKMLSWPDYKLNYLRFVIREKIFLGSAESGLTENLKINQISFKIKNDTSYSYYQVPLNIIVYRGDNIIAVTRYLINNFISREKRKIEINLVGYVAGADRVEIVPDVNIFDASVFMPLQ